MKIMVIAPKNKSVLDFRADLVRSFIACGHSVTVTGPNLHFAEDIRALGASFIEVPLRRDSIGIWSDIRYTLRLWSLFRREKPDRIFAYTIKPAIYGSLAARAAGIKSVYPMFPGLGRVWSGASGKAKLLQKTVGILYRFALSGCKKVIFQNPDDLAFFVEKKYVAAEKCERVYGSGVSTVRYPASPMPEKPVFLMVSRIIREKGVMEFCRAAEKVKAVRPDAEFILLGGYDSSLGGLGESDLAVCKEKNIVTIPGEVQDVVPYLKSAYVFVLPTYYREGVPHSILEAMSVGRPILTTDHVGARETVENGKNGFLVPIRDADALADKILWFLEHPQDARKMAAESRRIVDEKFDVRLVNRRMLEIMEIPNASEAEVKSN